MNKNENGGLNLKSTSETTDLQELIKDCNRVIITHSLEESISSPNGFKVRKMVVLFDGNGFCPETVNRSINEIMMRHNQSFVKSHLFILKLSTWIKVRIDLFKAALMRDILGIIPNSDISDWRDECNKYRNGRA